MTAELTVVTGFEKLEVEQCLESLRSGLRKLSIPTNGFSLYGEAVDLEQTNMILKAAGRSAFLLEGNGWRFHRTSIRHYAIDTLSVQAAWNSLRPDEWMGVFSAAFPVRQAWVADVEYDFWQNAEDPLQYKSHGRSYEHLPSRSNGLPPPLEQTVIDTSANPGRRILHVGYIEAVGSPIWIGEECFQITGANKERLMSEAWTNSKSTHDDLICLRPLERPFSSSEGESSQTQDKLRALLYPMAH